MGESDGDAAEDGELEDARRRTDRGCRPRRDETDEEESPVEGLDVEELLGEGVAELDIEALAGAPEEELVQETET